MIRKIIVVNRRFFHPLYWSKYIIGIIFVLYFIIALTFFYLGYRERNSVQAKSIAKIFQAKKREITNLKLSGVEPFIWKKAFHCESIDAKFSDKVKQLKKKNCIHTQLDFIKKRSDSIKFSKTEILKKLSNKKTLILEHSKHKFVFVEKMKRECSICHIKEQKLPVKWTFYGKIPEKQIFFANLITSKYFILLHLLWFFSWGMYFTFRYILFKYNKLNLVAFNFQFSPIGIKNFMKIWSNDSFLNKRFIFLESSNNFIRGYLHPNDFNILLSQIFEKNIFLQNNYTYRGAAIQVKDSFYSSFSFEGLKFTSALMQKANKNSLIIEDDILNKKNNLLSVDEKKALWKTKTGDYVFRIIQNHKQIK